MSDNGRNLPARTDGQRNPALHDNGLRAGNLIDQAISKLDEQQVKALGEKAAQVALDLQAQQARQNLNYHTGKKVVEDHIDTFNNLSKDGKTTRHTLNTDVETGAGRMRIESKSGATCFVATAAYGDAAHPDVVYLRWYRDNILRRSAVGRAFIWTYWRVGPQLAKVVQPFPAVRHTVRGTLSRLVGRLQARRPPSC